MLENDFDGARKIADTLGMKLVVCPHICGRPAPVGRRRLARLRRAPGQGRRSASQTAGYDFAWHNHDFEFEPLADGSVPQQHILDAAPDIGWEIDVAWVIRGGADPLPWIDRYGDRIVAVHVKDIAPAGEGPTRTAGPMSATARSTGPA